MAEDAQLDDIDLPNQVFQIAFHPQQDVIASALITGAIHLHKYSEEGHAQVLRLSHHSESCRDIVFTDDGSALLSASSDKSIAAIDTRGQLAWRQRKAHDHSINRLLYISENVMASGDDQGVVKLWDLREKASIVQFHTHTDFISGMTCDAGQDNLLATSGDATLSVYDLRQHRLVGRSDDQEDELLSVQIIKHGRKVVCSTQNGVLAVWSWGTWGDCSDRFPGHPQSVDALLKLDEDTLLTGSSDGLIRIVSIQPDKFLGLLGDHDEFPVESIKFSRDRQWLGSVSHDSKVRFWNAVHLKDEGGDDDDDGDSDASDAPMDTEAHDEGGEDCAVPPNSAEGAVVAHGSDDSDDSDDVSDEQEDPHTSSQARPGGSRNDFFADL